MNSQTWEFLLTVRDGNDIRAIVIDINVECIF